MSGIVFTYRCPLCQAKAGRPCASPWNGQPYAWPHIERIQAVTR